MAEDGEKPKNTEDEGEPDQSERNERSEQTGNDSRSDAGEEEKQKRVLTRLRRFLSSAIDYLSRFFNRISEVIGMGQNDEKSEAAEDRSEPEQDDEVQPVQTDDDAQRDIGGKERGGILKRVWGTASQTLLDPPIFIILIVISGLVMSLLKGWVRLDAESTLVTLAVLFSALFFAFERYVNKPGLGSSKDNEDGNRGYHPDLRIWAYGMVLGAGLAVLYLFARVVISGIDRPSEVSNSALTKADSVFTAGDTSASVADSTFIDLAQHSADVSSLAVWHDGLLLFFLSAALAVVMYALVNVSRAEI